MSAVLQWSDVADVLHAALVSGASGDVAVAMVQYQRRRRADTALDPISDAIDDDRFDDADALIQAYDTEFGPVGTDPDIVYYRAILSRCRVRRGVTWKP